MYLKVFGNIMNEWLEKFIHYCRFEKAFSILTCESYASDCQQFLNYLEKHEKISTKKAAELWELTTRAAREKLKRMVDRGLLNKIATSPKDPQAIFVLALLE